MTSPRPLSMARVLAPGLLATVFAIAAGLAPGSASVASAASFQSMVDSAPSGGTITVPPGTYREVVRVTRPLTINATGVTIDGEGVRTEGLSVINTTDVTVTGLTVTRINSATHKGAVWTTNSSRFTLRNAVAKDSATICVSLNGGTGHRILDTEMARCGKEGYFTNNVTDTLFRGNHIHHNNPALAFGTGDEAGGGKSMASTGVAFENNEVNHNNGSGLWWDNGAANVTATGNRIHHNTGEGIHFEISSGALIEGNAIWENGWGVTDGWGWGAGITVSSSDGAVIRNNTVAWNNRGISVISQNRQLSPHNGNVVHDNVIIGQQGGFVAGFYDDHGGSLFQPANDNFGYSNRYWIGIAESSTDRFGWDGPKNRLSDFNATPGEQNGMYLTSAGRDAALAAAGIPSDGGDPPPAAPRPSEPRMAFRSGQMASNGSMPGRITWGSVPGALAYQLQFKQGTGSFATVELRSARSRSATVRIPDDRTSRARVRVKYGSGSWSTWVYGPVVQPSRYQETHARLSFTPTPWSRQAKSGASGGYVRTRSTAGATATFTFSGRAVAWVAPKGTGRGKAKVYVDGVYRKTVDLYRATAYPRAVVFSAAWSTIGNHTVRIVVVGTAGRPRIDLDAMSTLR